MAPSKNKLRRLKTETSVEDLFSKSTYVSKPPERTSFLSLPVEIFDMILSCLQDIDEEDVLENPTVLSLECRERADVLRAFSQTSKGLRMACLPLAWERMEACTVTNPDGAWYKQVSIRLENVSKLVEARPYLAKHVRTVTVSLTRCSPETALPPLVRCLESLPNLETLQIVHAHSQMTTALKDAFEGHTFPRIRNITLPSCAHNILRCCPEVTQVVCNEDDGGKLVTVIQRICKKVESLRGIKASEPVIRRLAKASPSLREISLDARLPSERKLYRHPDTSVPALQLLSNLKQLRTIYLTVGELFYPPVRGNSKIFDSQIKTATEALKKIETQDEKKLVVVKKVYSLLEGSLRYHLITTDAKEIIL